MKFLLDTHIPLWAAYTPEKISPAAMAGLKNPASKIFYSAASLIEIAIKNSLGRADFYVNLPHLQEALQISGYDALPIKGDYALALESCLYPLDMAGLNVAYPIVTHEFITVKTSS